MLYMDQAARAAALEDDRVVLGRLYDEIPF
jgi:hypothetical protein